LEKISNLTTPNHVLAVVEQKKLTYEPVEKNNIMLVLDGIQDPGNLGTIIRIADWFGITQIVANTGTADVLQPKGYTSHYGQHNKGECLV
jgi:TrmH family RNA methyltransferase